MKTPSKKSKDYIKNSLSEKEIEDASKRFYKHKGPYLTMDWLMFSANIHYL